MRKGMSFSKTSTSSQAYLYINNGVERYILTKKILYQFKTFVKELVSLLFFPLYYIQFLLEALRPLQVLSQYLIKILPEQHVFCSLNQGQILLDR